MNGLSILFCLASCIYSREITTISYADRHNLAEKGLADVFKNEGAFVRPEIKVLFNHRKFRLLLVYRLNSPLQLCFSKEMQKIV